MTKRIRVQSVRTLGAAALVVDSPGLRRQQRSKQHGDRRHGRQLVDRAPRGPPATPARRASRHHGRGAATHRHGRQRPLHPVVHRPARPPRPPAPHQGRRLQPPIRSSATRPAVPPSRREVGDLHQRRVRGDVGLQLRPGHELRLLQDPGSGEDGLPGGAPPQASRTAPSRIAWSATTCGLCGGGYSDSAGASKVGYCVCQVRNRSGKRTWSCAATRRGPAPPARLLVRLTNDSSATEAAPAHEDLQTWPAAARVI